MALTFACSLALVLPLFMWQMLYPQSDWAALALLPLMLMIFMGSLKAALTRRQAELSAILLPVSGLNRWLRGRIMACLSATLVTVITVVLLASKTLTADWAEGLTLTALCISTFWVFDGLRSKLVGHVQPQFMPALATSLSALVTGTLFFPVYTWVSWTLIPVPGHLRGSGFNDAMMQGLTTLPDRSGWVTELLSLIVTLDNAKLWLFLNLGNNPLLLLVYVIYAATICFVLARGVAAIAALYRVYTPT
ncbi:hypothetical protein [Pseudohongiella spirulinae]|uniref:Uncharacterized protein n=1 Tax=Pseudohongiella spirulinae TaxID=1249552 RepID=A0A0S2KB21_9GAMM|nr:hypothetical protein [Pseudohongiella spirulinae]ALO45294.1 hypothetical protein PS2015_611 [Pseudohongiella spirulinae]